MKPYCFLLNTLLSNKYLIMWSLIKDSLFKTYTSKINWPVVTYMVFAPFLRSAVTSASFQSTGSNDNCMLLL